MQILGNNITNLKQKNRSDNFLRLNKIQKSSGSFFCNLRIVAATQRHRCQ